MGCGAPVEDAHVRQWSDPGGRTCRSVASAMGSSEGCWNSKIPRVAEKAGARGMRRSHELGPRGVLASSKRARPTASASWYRSRNSWASTIAEMARAACGCVVESRVSRAQQRVDHPKDLPGISRCLTQGTLGACGPFKPGQSVHCPVPHAPSPSASTNVCSCATFTRRGKASSGPESEVERAASMLYSTLQMYRKLGRGSKEETVQTLSRVVSCIRTRGLAPRRTRFIA